MRGQVGAPISVREMYIVFGMRRGAGKAEVAVRMKLRTSVENKTLYDAIHVYSTRQGSKKYADPGT